MLSRNNQEGFTLVEMIGVLAVIAILASVATPRIMESIEDAKVSKFIQQVKLLEGAVSKYYADTGTWPNLYSTQDIATNPHQHQLMKNAANGSGATVNGWQGPYLDREPQHPFGDDSLLQYMIVTSTAAYTCDVDGDGTADGSFYIYRIDGVGDKLAEKISNIFDKDGGTANWKTQGRVKRYAGTHASILVVCLFRT